MARDDEHFLARWSRRKGAAASGARAPEATAEQDSAAPPLPDPTSLTFESDFKAFMHAKVEERVKRAALKKLFADPHFNVMDGLDIYIDDYSQDSVMPPGMAETLEHSKSALFGPRPEPEARPPDAGGEAPDALAQGPDALAQGPHSSGDEPAPKTAQDGDAVPDPERNEPAPASQADEEPSQEGNRKDVAAG